MARARACSQRSGIAMSNVPIDLKNKCGRNDSTSVFSLLAKLPLQRTSGCTQKAVEKVKFSRFSFLRRHESRWFMGHQDRQGNTTDSSCATGTDINGLLADSSRGSCTSARHIG